jgi:hypothetical protein
MSAPDPGAAFAISTPSASIMLPPNRSAEVPFTVTNLSGRALRAKATPRGLGSAPAEWFKLAGDAELQFDEGAIKQVKVIVDPALGAMAGSYAFRLDVTAVESPETAYAEGPECAVAVPGSSTGLTTPRGYLATMVGAAAGGVLWLIALLVIWLVISNAADEDCADLGDCIGQIIGLAILFGLLILAALALMIVGAAIGIGVALRIRHYRGNKLTATFFGVLMVPWTILIFWILSLLDFLPEVVLVILVPILLLFAPALLARALVLLIRTHRI